VGYATSLEGTGSFPSSVALLVSWMTATGSGPDPEQGLGGDKEDLLSRILLLMAELLHQLIVYPIICSGLYIPGGQDFFHQQ